MRTIVGTVRGTSHEKLYKEAGFITLKERRQRHKLILYFKYVNGLLPEHVSIKFPELITELNPYSASGGHNPPSPRRGGGFAIMIF